MTKFEDQVVISGAGRSDFGRRAGRSELDLAVDACRDAITDAGLTAADIDGVVAWPGEVPAPPGFTGPAALRVSDALALGELTFHGAWTEGASQLAGFFSACHAVAAGVARHVLVYRATTESTGQGTGGRQATSPADAGGIVGHLQWLRPFGAVSAAHWMGLMAARYVHEYGLKREQLGWLAVNHRAHAALTPHAVYREPITLDDYLASRMISTPLCLFDCDVPCDAAVAFVVSAAETVPGLRKPVRIEAIGSAFAGRPYWDQFTHPTDMAAHAAARHLWSRTDLRQGDVDVAQLYDGFSFITLAWLEALGFCGPGEAGAFIEGRERIRIGGELPLNTGGGQLSGGRVHGHSLLYENCVQLRGEAGERQVADAEVALTSAGAGPLGGAVLLTALR
ncbi:MAG: thiolase family protein [Mycobacterium sp.]|nr:thiolase family protein [Mycobacterium sp.]